MIDRMGDLRRSELLRCRICESVWAESDLQGFLELIEEENNDKDAASPSYSAYPVAEFIGQ